MNTYTLFWNGGNVSVVTGNTIVKAIIDAGFAAAHAKNLNFYMYGDTRHTMEWSHADNKWVSTHHRISDARNQQRWDRIEQRWIGK